MDHKHKNGSFIPKAYMTNPDQFNKDFYLKAYRDVNPKMVNPLVHYYTVGKKEDRLPNSSKFEELYPSFDANTYASNNIDLSSFTQEELMSHYHHHGRHENRISKKVSSRKKDNQDIYDTKKITYTTFIDLVNFKKILQCPVHMNNNILLDPILNNIIDKVNRSKPTYLVISEWGLPPFGGGEAWLIDTTKWMKSSGFDCYYIYFNDSQTGKDFDRFEIANDNTCMYIRFVRDVVKLLRFVSSLNPAIVAHQGLRRMDYIKIANLLDKPFLTGFCFWQDIIKMNKGEIINQNMIDKSLIADENFKFIFDNAYCYLASKFMLDIVKKVHGVELPIINTISDESQYKIIKPDNNVYVTAVNICGLKGGLILEEVINSVPADIPFLLIDSQDSEADINKKLKKCLIERNKIEKLHKSVYIKGPITDMKAIYQQTRILLIPTLVDETFCRVGYEGMMNEIPILSTTCGNLRYLLDGYADFLDSTPRNWSDKIKQIYNDPEQLSVMSHRLKTINPNDDRAKFIHYSYQCMMTNVVNYMNNNNVGILCPWADQGLGIQCREYYDILGKCGYNVSIFSFKPYHSTPQNPKLQSDPSEWNYKNIYYCNSTREEINTEEFISYLHQYRVKNMIIVETCYPKVFELAKICRMLSIRVLAIPNLETLRYSEIHKHDVFDKILCNNQMTYDILSKYYQDKSKLFGFRILNKNFGIEKKYDNTPSFFCSGGLNSLTRKNIDKIILAFIELETENKIGSFKLYVYIQGVEIPQNIDKYRSNNIIFSVGQKSYAEIVTLYKKHDIFIHMGDHEGLGLGFYESIVCGTPVFTIDTPPNNEIIHEKVNGWLVRCDYTPLNDNKEGITLRASLKISDIKAKLHEIITSYNREQMYSSTINDYVYRYPLGSYVEQIRSLFT